MDTKLLVKVYQSIVIRDIINHYIHIFNETIVSGNRKEVNTLQHYIPSRLKNVYVKGRDIINRSSLIEMIRVRWNTQFINYYQEYCTINPTVDCMELLQIAMIYGNAQIVEYLMDKGIRSYKLKKMMEDVQLYIGKPVTIIKVYFDLNTADHVRKDTKTPLPGHINSDIRQLMEEAIKTCDVTVVQYILKRLDDNGSKLTGGFFQIDSISFKRQVSTTNGKGEEEEEDGKSDEQIDDIKGIRLLSLIETLSKYNMIKNWSGFIKAACSINSLTVLRYMKVKDMIINQSMQPHAGVDDYQFNLLRVSAEKRKEILNYLINDMYKLSVVGILNDLIRLNDLETIQMVFEQKQRDTFEHTSLDLALQLGHLDIANYLIESVQKVKTKFSIIIFPNSWNVGMIHPSILTVDLIEKLFFEGSGLNMTCSYDAIIKPLAKLHELDLVFQLVKRKMKGRKNDIPMEEIYIEMIYTVFKSSDEPSAMSGVIEYVLEHKKQDDDLIIDLYYLLSYHRDGDKNSMEMFEMIVSNPQLAIVITNKDMDLLLHSSEIIYIYWDKVKILDLLVVHRKSDIEPLTFQIYKDRLVKNQSRSSDGPVRPCISVQDFKRVLELLVVGPNNIKKCITSCSIVALISCMGVGSSGLELYKCISDSEVKTSHLHLNCLDYAINKGDLPILKYILGKVSSAISLETVRSSISAPASVNQIQIFELLLNHYLMTVPNGDMDNQINIIINHSNCSTQFRSATKEYNFEMLEYIFNTFYFSPRDKGVNPPWKPDTSLVDQHLIQSIQLGHCRLIRLFTKYLNSLGR